jgi:hypothetical protein
MAQTEIDIRLLPGFSIIEELEAGKNHREGEGGSGDSGLTLFSCEACESMGCEARYNIEICSRWSQSYRRDLPSHRERAGVGGVGGGGSVLPLYISGGKHIRGTRGKIHIP